MHRDNEKKMSNKAKHGSKVSNWDKRSDVKKAPKNRSNRKRAAIRANQA